MPMIPARPYRILTTAEGSFFPYYIIPFDADGRCEGPATLQHVLNHCVDILIPPPYLRESAGGQLRRGREM